MSEQKHVLSIVFSSPDGAIVLCRVEGEQKCWLESYTEPGKPSSTRPELGTLRGSSPKMEGDQFIFVYLLELKPEWQIQTKDTSEIKNDKEARLRYMGQSIARHIDPLLRVHLERL